MGKSKAFLSAHKKLLMLVLLLLLGWGGYAYWGNSGDGVVYITEPVKRQNIQKVVNATGEVRASELVTVGAQASGKIEKLYVTIGQQVKKGDMIAQIDSTTQQNDVDTNKARLNSYQAQLSAAKVSLDVAKKQYDRTAALKKKNGSGGC